MSRTPRGNNFSDRIVPIEQKQPLKREAVTFETLLFGSECFFIAIFGVWFTYATVTEGDIEIHRQYNYFRDVNIMIFFGFGFLMTFLRKYAYSAIGYTFLVSALVIQWSIILQAFAQTIATSPIKFSTVPIDMNFLTNGLFCAAAVMISYGAILGKVTPLQMVFIALIEPMFYWLNTFFLVYKLEAIGEYSFLLQSSVI